MALWSFTTFNTSESTSTRASRQTTPKSRFVVTELSSQLLRRTGMKSIWYGFSLGPKKACKHLKHLAFQAAVRTPRLSSKVIG
jgi:hypothetical protein